MVSCNIRQFDQTLKKMLKDETNEPQSKKWPLVIDPTETAGTFLRYRDVNYLQAQNPQDMENHRIRLGVLGALRFGKLCVVDLGDTDMYHIVVDAFNKVNPNLMDWIMTGEITNEEKYKHLIIEKEDGKDYNLNNFSPMFIENFGFVFITKMQSLPEELVAKTNKLTIS